MSEWISVDDRLPERFEQVLVTDGKLMVTACVDEYSDFYPVNVDVTYDMADVVIGIDTITHWMPLPEPPVKEM